MAIAYEAGVDLDIFEFGKVSMSVPHMVPMIPAGQYTLLDFYEAGGIPVMMKELASILMLDGITCTGHTSKENIDEFKNKNTDVIRGLSNPVHKRGGIAVLKGNIAPDGAVTKPSAIPEKALLFRGPAKIYESEQDALIGISFPRYSMRTLKAMEFANNRKARVIAITDSVHSPMNMYSSCNLFARSDMASIVDSLVAPMSLINALIVSICLKNSEQVVENIEKINTFVDNFEYSGNDEINMLDENVVNELRKCMDNAAIDDEK